MFNDFNEIKIGDSASIVKDISRDDIKRFVELTGDDNPLHVDPVYAEKTSFKDVVVHGMLGASFISTVIGTKLPGSGALWVSQAFDFLRPVRLGDQIKVVCTVEAKDEKRRRLTLKTEIFNQLKELVLSGTGVVHVLETTPEENVPATINHKVAIVTGAAGGIGQAISMLLAQNGYSVVANYHTNEAKASDLVNNINNLTKSKAIMVQADITEKKGIEKLYNEARKAFGAPSILVHNASPPINPQPLEDLDWSFIQQHLDVQLKAAVNICKTVVPSMKENGFGRLIFITSQITEGAPPANWTAYGVAKSSVAAFSRFLAQELGPNGITSNCVAPGMTDTVLIRDIPEKLRLMTARATPTRKITSVEDVASAVLYLASEQSKQVNGQTIWVSGGINM